MEEGGGEEKRERRRVRATAGGGSGSAAPSGEYDPSATEKRRPKQKSSSGGGSSSGAGGSAGGGNVFALMQDVHDKLVLLDYERRFCREYSQRPQHAAYLAMPGSNPLEQLAYFASLAHWLSGECGHSFERPNPFVDDPSEVVTMLVRELKAGGRTDAAAHPPAMLKKGHGPACLSVLRDLADAALSARHFAPGMMEQPDDLADDPADELDDIEDDGDERGALLDAMVGDDGIHDDIGDGDDIDDDEDALGGGLDGGGASGAGGAAGSGAGFDGGLDGDGGAPAVSKKILESSVNPAQWKLELERVAPQLKVAVQGDVREWRTRLETMQTFLAFVGENFPDSQKSLEKISAEVRQVLDKLQSREKYLNAQLEHHITDYRVVQERLQELNDKHRSCSDRVEDAESELTNLTDDLEQIKDQLQNRGSSMTDTSPINKIKNAIAQIKTDVQQMEVRIKIMQTNLLQVRMAAAR